VRHYMVNSAVVDLKDAPPGTPNPADKGFGAEAVALEKAPGTGVEADQKRDVASAYVTLKKKGTGEALGTYLVSVYWKPQRVTIDGQPYDLSLRFRRSYRDYTLYLKEFKHDVYVGTNTPRNYSSLVQVVDPATGEDHEELIWMNHPLFYRGETFYQSQVQQDTAGNETGTVLQVVRNPGWMMPYLSCLMVSLGMALHFGLNLINFLNRGAAA
jgi:ResB-like family